MHQKPVYTLAEIARWSEENLIILPTVQRGFVWHPSQIENLWDSLLRGYPIGAFVLAANKSDRLEILDGQQRATAICLGFNQKTFRSSEKHIRVFIDIEQPRLEDSRKYLFRVITRSHPWGYQKNENSRTLTAVNIRNAMDIYEIEEDVPGANLEYYFPFDAHFPVPFHYFLDAVQNQESVEVLINNLKKWRHWTSIRGSWTKSCSETIDYDGYIFNRIKVIYEATAKMLCNKTGQRVPALYMSLDELIAGDDDNVNIDAADEIETLFVRLNSGGTQLTGEELNYSILKAHLTRETQDIIEDACKALFRPARFITIAFRLFLLTNGNEEQQDSLSMRIKPKQFQRSVSKHVEPFERFLVAICKKKEVDGQFTLLEYVKNILAYESKFQSYALPFLIYSKISDKAPELMFLLLYRIWECKDRFSSATPVEQGIHRRALGIFTLFLWFGKGEGQKDHSRLLSNIWPMANTLSQQQFWSADVVSRASINDALIPFPYYSSTKRESGLDFITVSRLTKNSNVVRKFNDVTDGRYESFLRGVMYNRDLLIYAQRGFLEQYFKDEQYRLDDTNMPFDWDHISPSNFVYKRKHIPPILKDWYGTIGNFRAWPYALNRMDSNKSPAFKLKPLCHKQYDEQYVEKARLRWQEFVNRNKHIIGDLEELEERLLEWSFCEVGWANCAAENLRYDWLVVTRLIVDRNLKIIGSWYHNFIIDHLKKHDDFYFNQILLKQTWGGVPQKNIALQELFNDENKVSFISKSFSLGNHSLRFYFQHPDGSKKFLEANSIAFGIVDENRNGYLKRMTGKLNAELDIQDFQWMEQKFTLLSGSKRSVIAFIGEIISWLMALPVSSADRNELKDRFKETIVKKYILDMPQT